MIEEDLTQRYKDAEDEKGRGKNLTKAQFAVFVELSVSAVVFFPLHK